LILLRWVTVVLVLLTQQHLLIQQQRVIKQWLLETKNLMLLRQEI
jgi:hypothetical protein